VTRSPRLDWRSATAIALTLAAAPFGVPAAHAHGSTSALGPFLSVADASVVEGDGPAPRLLVFRIFLSEAIANAVTATMETRDGTATAATDYIARTFTLTIPAGATSTQFVVVVRSDNLQEYAPPSGLTLFEDFSLEERMTARIVSATGATILDRTGTGRITEDDRAFDSFARSANGHSWANAYLLGLASHYVYRGELGAPTETEFRMRFSERFGKLGLTTVRHVSRTATDNDLQAVVLRNATALVIVFRGTQQPEDFLTDAELTLFPLSLVSSVHLGFWLSVDSAYAELRDLARAAGTRQIWVTGHSLGGALANILAYRLQQDGIAVKGAYTYGAPRVGNAGFALAYNTLFADRPTQRWVNANDPIPLAFPPQLGFVHAGQYNHIVKSPFSSIFHVNLNVLVEVPVIPDATAADHDGARYLNRIRAAAPASVRARMPVPPSTN